MTVYSYYYGASVERGIGIQAQSVELENVPFRSMLKELSSMHALKSSEHDGEMLSYMLSADEYSVLGTSYLESPKSSGYGRSAPCGLIYVAPSSETEQMEEKLGKIINFAQFQKPADNSPAPLKDFLLNESGYSYHSGSAVLMSLIDGLLKVLFSKNSTLIVGIPKGRSSEYATARYAIAEALNYLPISLRSKISFFTGLPVADNENDALKGFDNAVHFGANVIFCASEHFAVIKKNRTCVCVDMEQPSTQVCAFAAFITNVPGTSAALAQVNDCISGKITFEELNKAAQNVRDGKIETKETLRKKLKDSQSDLSKSKEEYLKLSKELEKSSKECEDLKKRNESLESAKAQLEDKNKQLMSNIKKDKRAKTSYSTNGVKNVQGKSTQNSKGKRSFSSWMLIVGVVVAVFALFALCVWLFSDFFDSDKIQADQPTPGFTQEIDSSTQDEPKEDGDEGKGETNGDAKQPEIGDVDINEDNENTEKLALVIMNSSSWKIKYDNRMKNNEIRFSIIRDEARESGF